MVTARHCVGETKGELDGHQIMNNQPKTKEKGFMMFITFRNYLQKEQGLQRVDFQKF